MKDETIKGVQAFLDSCENHCEPAGYVAFQWSMEGVGFGSVGFYVKNEQVHCNNELMSRRFIKDILCQMVDDCVMEEPNKKDIT